MGIIKYNSHSGYIASVISEDNLKPIISEASGIYRRLKNLLGLHEFGLTVFVDVSALVSLY